jgi:hypothetical protein
MTREEIAKVRARLAEIKGNNYKEQEIILIQLIDELGLSRAFTGQDGKEIVVSRTQTINTHLQTEMMWIICESAEKSCKSAEESSKTAKWSCFWAALSAFLVAISIFLMMCP